jgi:hypothetical protein
VSEHSSLERSDCTFRCATLICSTLALLAILLRTLFAALIIVLRILYIAALYIVFARSCTRITIRCAHVLLVHSLYVLRTRSARTAHSLASLHRLLTRCARYCSLRSQCSLFAPLMFSLFALSVCLATLDYSLYLSRYARTLCSQSRSICTPFVLRTLCAYCRCAPISCSCTIAAL